MFEKFMKILKTESLLKKNLELLKQMFELDTELFNEAIGSLEKKDESIRKKLSKRDHEVNLLERNVRKKVLEHLSIQPKQDLTSALIMLNVGFNLERIGDYCKNIAELSGNFEEKALKSTEFKQLQRISSDINELMPLTRNAFYKADEELAGELVQKAKKIGKDCDYVIIDLLEGTGFSQKSAISMSLLARYLKRISAHLKNISYGIVEPFHLAETEKE